MSAFAATNGPVIEFGCGQMSTPVLHALCAGASRPLLSLDNNPDWLYPVAKVYQRDWHRFHLVEDWSKFLGTLGVDDRFGLAFVDQDPACDRAPTITKMLELATIVVVHDTEPDRKERPEERPWTKAVAEAMAAAEYRANYHWGPAHNDVSILSNRRPVDFDLPFAYGDEPR